MANPFVHCELSADDVDAARKFYGELFDWKIGPADPTMGDYAMIDVGSTMSGGGLTKKMTPGQPTAWLTYVQVDSVKDTMAKAVAAGATAVVAFQEIGPMGAIGVFVDPQGAALGVWELGEAAKQAAAEKAKPKKVAKKVVKKVATKPAAKKVVKVAKKAAKKPPKAKTKAKKKSKK
jgi:predicted enzyme related to lactoylglutathione lyase